MLRTQFSAVINISGFRQIYRYDSCTDIPLFNYLKHYLKLLAI